MSSLKLRFIIITYAVIVGGAMGLVFGKAIFEASMPYISLVAAGIFPALCAPKSSRATIDDDKTRERRLSLPSL
jgi:hypothetical protein